MDIVFYLEKTRVCLYEKSENKKQLLDTLEKNQGHTIEKQFLEFWKKNYTNISNAQNLVLELGQQAGFTDTRVISIWCRSEILFNPTKTFNVKKGDTNSKKINYSVQPRIGTKKV